MSRRNRQPGRPRPERVEGPAQGGSGWIVAPLDVDHRPASRSSPDRRSAAVDRAGAVGGAGEVQAGADLSLRRLVRRRRTSSARHDARVRRSPAVQPLQVPLPADAARPRRHVRAVRDARADRDGARRVRLGRLARADADLRVPAHLRRQGRLGCQDHGAARHGDVHRLVRRRGSVVAHAHDEAGRPTTTTRAAPSCRRRRSRSPSISGCVATAIVTVAFLGRLVSRLAARRAPEFRQARAPRRERGVLVVQQRRGVEHARRDRVVRGLSRRAVPDDRVDLQRQSRRSQSRGRLVRALPVPPKLEPRRPVRRPGRGVRRAELPAGVGLRASPSAAC